MNRIAYWEPMPYLRKEPVRLPPGEGCPPKFFRCTHCLKPANGHRTPFCPWCGYKADKEIQRKDKKTVEVDLVEMKRQDDIRNTRLSDAELHTWGRGGRISEASRI